MSGPGEKIANAVRGVAQHVGQRVGEAAGRRSGSPQQTLTVGRPAAEVAALWRDPAAMAQVLGELGTVDVVGDRWTWHLARPGSDEPVEWRTTLTDGGSPRTLRWADPEDGSDGASEVVVVLRDAPQDLGTEQVVRLSLPLPDLAVGAAALGLGYRARALLLTGEVPTITPQPASRGAAK